MSRGPPKRAKILRKRAKILILGGFWGSGQDFAGPPGPPARPGPGRSRTPQDAPGPPRTAPGLQTPAGTPKNKSFFWNLPEQPPAGPLPKRTPWRDTRTSFWGLPRALARHLTQPPDIISRRCADTTTFHSSCHRNTPRCVVDTPQSVFTQLCKTQHPSPDEKYFTH